MYYIIKLICINKNNPYNLLLNKEVWISDVFGTENKYNKDKSRAYQFLSLQRAQSIVQKINKNHIFHSVIIKTY